MSSIEGRKSNFELLRIFSMVLIILYHLVLYGCGRAADSYSLSNIIYSFFSCGGKLGVALFIMITGYFMIDKDKDINIKKMVRLEGQVLFYSFLSFLIYNIFTFGEITDVNVVLAQHAAYVTFAKRESAEKAADSVISIKDSKVKVYWVQPKKAVARIYYCIYCIFSTSWYHFFRKNRPTSTTSSRPKD